MHDNQVSNRSWFFRIIISAACVLAISKPAWPADWQWSIAVKGGIDKLGPARAFLWIPPNCQKLRGLILAQHNMEEISILENPKFRRALGELDFAEIWCAPPFDHLFRFNEGAGDTFNGMMEDLAKESGYEELKYIPVIGIGHSAAASWPYYFAAWNPDRTLAAISVSGQWPYVRNPTFSPDIWGDRTIDFIPALETMGEYESANTWSAEGLKERQQHPLMPLSMLACPAEGHFAATDKKVEYLALYVKKAVQYRMSENIQGDKPVRLKPIDPTKTGWLADKWRLNKEPTAPAAPVGQYTGDPKQAFWFFDEDLAKATEAYQAAYRGLEPQLIGYEQEGQVVPQKNNHLQFNLKFLPEADGVTFKLAGSFYDTVPGGSPRPANWSGLSADSPIGHASGGGSISIDRICGPFVKLGPDTFILHFDKTGIGDGKRPFELVFAATHPGDNEYKPAVQQAQMTVPARNTAGREQHITFPEIPDRPIGAKSIKLGASCDSGAKVYYYVLAGPADVDGDVLKITPVPPRSRFPVKITIVAWQYGRTVEPKSKTADSVERSFYLTK
jgi:hypothetical protein